MDTTKPKKGHKRGRPVTKPIPKRIPDTPENIARALLTTPPKRAGEWRYQTNHHAQSGHSGI